jgi:hypothetical protein
MMKSEIHGIEEPSKFHKLGGEIRENIFTYCAIFILLGIGIYFFATNILFDSIKYTLCCTPGLMGFVVILMGALLARKGAYGSGLLIAVIGIAMIIITIMGLLYTMVMTVSMG